MQKQEADTAASGPAVRIIKKYPNRRLYDTNSSSYITLAEVKDLVMRGESFVVRDAKSGDDLTRSILLQIILEEETAGVPLFSESMLANLIRFYGHAMQGYMGTYLEKNLQLFMDLQKSVADPSKGFSPELWQQFMGMQTPVMPGMAGMSAFTQMQEKMLEAMGVKR